MDGKYRSRVPKGQSTGGQFTHGRQKESKVTLLGSSNDSASSDDDQSPDFSPEHFGDEQMRSVMEDPKSDLAERLSAVHSMNPGASDLALADSDPLVRAQTVGLVDSTQEQWNEAMSDPETRRIYNFLTQE